MNYRDCLHKSILSLLIFIIFLSDSYKAQSQRIDSLRKVLQSMPEDSNKVLTMDIFVAEWRDYDIQQMKAYAQEMYALGEKLGFRKGLAMANMQNGRYIF